MAKTAVSVTADAPGVNVHVLEVELMHTKGVEDQWSNGVCERRRGTFAREEARSAAL